MNLRLLRLLSASPLLFAAAVACSSSSKTTPPPVDAGKDAHKTSAHDAVAEAEASTQGGTDAHPDAIDDPNNCVKPGTPSSENGIGGYCSPGAGQCKGAGLGGVVTICTADVGAPMHEWFCTSPCSDAGMCGGSGSCLQAPFGQICVPAACAAGLGDAGSDVVDGGTDATLDGSSSHDAGKSDVAAHDSGDHDGSSLLDGDVDGKKPSDAESDAHAG